MRLTLKNLSGLALLAGLLHLSAASAQVLVTSGYNPMTGTVGKTATGYNPYTGGRGAAGYGTTSTGAHVSGAAGYNPVTGTAARTGSYYNPYTGTAAHANRADH